MLRRLGLHLFANFFAQRLDIDLLEEFLDALGAHHGDELAGEFLIQLPLAFVADDFALAQPRAIARFDDHKRFEIENALEFAQRDVQKMADARRQTLEEPHV